MSFILWALIQGLINKQPFFKTCVLNNNKQSLKLLPDIIEGCHQSQQREQRFLYEKYFGYCLKIVFRYIYTYDKAVDVVNDGFVKVFRNFSRFHYNDAGNVEMILMGWMRTIMVNTAIDELRKNNFLPEIGYIPDSVWNCEDISQGSDRMLLYKELVKEIKKLPPAYRTVFNMYVIDGFTHQEIANQLSISIGTSKSNLSKARVYLQKILKTTEKQETYAICK
jgi:RNA polymerase sigma factor (sigma-70 family)